MVHLPTCLCKFLGVLTEENRNNDSIAWLSHQQTTGQPRFLADSKKLLEAGDQCSHWLCCGWTACSSRPLTGINISSVNSSGSGSSDMRGQQLTEFMINIQTHSCSSAYQREGRVMFILDNHLEVDLGIGVNKTHHKTVFWCSGQTPSRTNLSGGSFGILFQRQKKGVS